MGKRLLTGGFSALAMMVLILDGKTALEGAAAGLELCIRVVIPSLFPFFLLSHLLTSSLAGSSLPAFRPLCRLFGTPAGSEAILLSGFLGGYPVGAQSICNAWKSGALSKSEAENLLCFCNNAGPAFLFGMVGSFFPESWMVWLLWLIHLVSAFLVSLGCYRSSTAVRQISANTASLPASMAASLRNIANVCGWVMVFRVLITFLDRWLLWLLPEGISVFVIGMLELSNGCSFLSRISSIQLRFVVCSVMLAFGGLCVIMQTSSVTPGLSKQGYLLGKGLQALYSLLLSCAVVWPDGRAICLALLTLPVVEYLQKNSSIPKAVGV